MTPKKSCVILLGGNSVIGNSLATGIALRLRVPEKIYVVRNRSQQYNCTRVIEVNNYNDLEFSKIALEYDVKAIIFSFGILKLDKNDFAENFSNNFQVNVIQPLRLLEEIAKSNPRGNAFEIHLVSSILADFTRKSLFSYSLTKQIIEKIFMERLKTEQHNIFIWKFAFVDSPLNSGRAKSMIYTTTRTIEKKGKSCRKSGTYYVPSFSKFPSKVLKVFPKLTSLFK